MEPKETASYKTREYWDDRFEKEEVYDWVAEWDHYGPTLVEHLDVHDRILVLGCGNSELSGRLFELGFRDVVNVDFSDVVIRKMRERYPGMKWISADIRDMRGRIREELGIESVDGWFDAVVEKAAFDALIADSKSQWEPEEASKKDMDSALSEVSYLLKSDARLTVLSITFQQPHFQRRFFEASDHLSVDTVTRLDGKALDAFFFVAKKTKKTDA